MELPISRDIKEYYEKQNIEFLKEQIRKRENSLIIEQMCKMYKMKRIDKCNVSKMCKGNVDSC